MEISIHLGNGLGNGLGNSSEIGLGNGSVIGLGNGFEWGDMALTNQILAWKFPFVLGMVQGLSWDWFRE